MPLYEFLTTGEIKTLFADEISAAGGSVSDIYDDGSLLFARSILPQVREVRVADQLQGGVALRSSERDIRVHPYVFRLVCRNGAIMAHAIQTRHVEIHEFTTREEATTAVREAIQTCCAEDVFTASVREIRSSLETEADLALNLLPFVSRMNSESEVRVFRTFMERFFQETDRSRFALMNAVTSVARDSSDPHLRWRLEELGGGIAACRTPVIQPDDAMAAALVG